MSEHIISAGIGIVTSVIGNKITEKMNEKKRKEKKPIICRVVGTPYDEVLEKELRPKETNSDYSIEFYNLSNDTIIADYFDIYTKDHIVAGSCTFSDDEQKIEPKSKVRYILMEQDADALIWHCEKEKFAECSIILYTIDGNKMTISLDVESILFASSIKEDIINDIV